MTVNKVYKKLGGDTTVEFTIYQTSEATDLSAVSSYLDKNAKADETLTAAGSGSAVLVKGGTSNIAYVIIDTLTE